MALSDDQRAMLRLLAQREEGYEDIAALKGMSVDEVRAEVKAALSELASSSAEPAPPAAPAGPTEPVPSPSTPRSEPAEPTAAAPAKPKPAAAGIANAESTPRSSSARSARAPGGRRAPRSPIPPERRRLLALTGAAVGIVALVLIAIALIGGGSDSGSSVSPEGANGEVALEAENSKLTQAVLEAPDGGDASGRAVFGKVGKEEIVLQVTAEGLDPTAAGESYTVWLYRTPKLSLRVGGVSVDDSGRLGARFPIPAELLAYVASGAFDQIYISRTSNAAYRSEVAQAKKNKSLPRYTGETVLSGEITGPIAKR